MERAVALMLTAFLLVSVLPVSTMASDKAAASRSTEAVYYDRLLETAPIEEAASDTDAEIEVETVQEYERGAGDETGALFGCETGTEEAIDALYGTETGAGDETGALFGYDAGGETGALFGYDAGSEDRNGLTEMPAEAAAWEKAGAGAQEENTIAEEGFFDDLRGEIAATASDSEELPGEGISAEEAHGEEPVAENADGEGSGVEEPVAENADGEGSGVEEPGTEDADGEGSGVEEPGTEDADGEGSGVEEPDVREDLPEQTALEETDKTDNETIDNETTDNKATDYETAYPSSEAGSETNESEVLTEDIYSEEAAAASETGNAADPADPAGSVPGDLPEALADQTQTGPDSEAGAASVDERAALTAMNLSLTDQVVMNIYVRADDSVEADDYIEFSYAGETLQQRVGDASVNRMTLADGEAFDVLSFELPLRMRQMTDDVTFRMVVDGVEGTPKTRTVRSYADLILQGQFSDEQKEVTRAMLNCGSCAQEYFGYNTDRPANAGIYGPGQDPVRDWEDPDLSSYDYALYQESLLGFEFCETTLELQEDISLICYFRVGEGHFFDNFANWFYDFSLRGSDLDLTPGYDRDKGMYYVRIPHIMPYELDEMFEIEVTNRFTGFSRRIASLRYSPLTYCRDMLASDSSSPEIKNLCRSLYYYCNASKIMRSESSSALEK